MDSAVTPASIIAVICCFVIPLIGYMVFTFLVPTTPESFLSFLYFKSLKKEEEDLKQWQNALVERGVVAEAKILSVRSMGDRQKLSGGPYKARVEYDVEVMPEGQPSFRSIFQYWLPLSWKNGTGEAIRQESEENMGNI